MKLAILVQWAMVCLTLSASAQSSDRVYEKLFSFADAKIDIPTNPLNHGAESCSRLVQDVEGNFYGTTSTGGTSGLGTVFKMTREGVLTTLVDFTGLDPKGTGLNLGSNPLAGLVMGNDGNFYGTTSSGGFATDKIHRGCGTIFMIHIDRATGATTLTTLYKFNASGSTPLAGLLLGKDGKFYGTTSVGGIGFGIIFQMTTDGTSQGTSLKSVNLTGKHEAAFPHRGASPSGDLVQSSDGNFYGTTSSGGVSGGGTVFQMTADMVLTTLLDFTADTGMAPMGGLIQDSSGNFYGTTSAGGQSGFGAIFKFAVGDTTPQPLVHFEGSGKSGANKLGGASPLSSLTLDSSERFIYGTSSAGGLSGNGTLFKLDLDGTSPTTLVEFSFNGTTTSGANPAAALLLASDGNFYGTTQHGGDYQKGTLFKMTPGGESFTTMVHFTGDGSTNKGSAPTSALVQGGLGNYYGTTVTGGQYGGGTVFKMTPDGALKTFHEFKDADLNEKEGRAPQSGLAWKDNYLYGTTSKGGAGGFGTIFKISPDGTTFTTLLRFSGREDGQNRGAAPLASLVLDKNKQYFYGTTSSGGKYGYGTAFKFSDDGTTVPSITTLVDFSGDRDPNPSDDHSVKGSASMASLVQDSDGNFYGTTSTGGTEGKGTVFKMTADGEATTLVDFNETTDLNDPKRGSTPMAGLVLSEGDAYIYGTTFGGGTNRKGTVFKIKPDGTAMRTLVDFTGYDSDPLETQRGSGPTANLLLNDGTIYGTTSEGGFFDKGTIFKLTLHPSPQLSTLLDFTGDGNMNRGSAPAAGLVMDQNGDSLYGTTKHGGNSEKGTVFKFSLGTELLTTEVEFAGDGNVNQGRDSDAALVQGRDGCFYGTTSNGGAYDYGTIFKMTPGGLLTTLIAFTGDDLNIPNRGSGPHAILAVGADGNFYGTTYNGGTAGQGTVFMMHTDGTPEGSSLATLQDFKGRINGKSPAAGLVLGSDGAFYGTTCFGGESDKGTVFRIRTNGTSEGTEFDILVNFKGGKSDKWRGSHPKTRLLEHPMHKGRFYGTTSAGGKNDDKGTIFMIEPQTEPKTNQGTKLDFKGKQPITTPNRGTAPTGDLVYRNGYFYGTTSSGGASGTGTVFRFDVQNDESGGITLRTVQDFPAANNPAGELRGSAPQAGLVLDNNGNFYGTTSAGGDATFGTIFRITPNADIDLEKNSFETLVDFPTSDEGHPSAQLVAATDGNLYGITNGPDGCLYRLLFPETGPVVSDPRASATGSDRAIVEARVNPCGSPTTVTLEYGKDGVEFRKSAPVTINLTGFQTRLVGTTLSSDLHPYTTYFYRFRATDLNQHSNLSPVASFTTLAAVDPSNLGRIKPVGQVAATKLGSIQVTLTPSDINSAWRFVGESDRSWKKSETYGHLTPNADRQIEFREVTGYDTPFPKSVRVNSNETTPVSGNYQKSSVTNVSIPSKLSPRDQPPKPDAGAGQPPEPVDDPTKFFSSCIGQILFKGGSASGFVVKQHVVATAAHVVFDNSTYTDRTELQWLFQRQRGAYEPVPQIPLGWYKLDDYAAIHQQENQNLDLANDKSGPAGYSRDVAVLYFAGEDAGRGGSSGYLASDTPSFNEFLESTDRNKILAGYAINDPSQNDHLFATPPITTAFIPHSTLYPWLYTTSDIYGLGGMSGGPLLVQKDGKYYPAAIYVGHNAQAATVRSINSEVIDLFNRAEVNSIIGDNNNSSGIANTSAPGNEDPNKPGSLRFLFTPAAVEMSNNGLLWKLTGKTDYLLTNTEVLSLDPGPHPVEFQQCFGFKDIRSKSVTVKGGLPNVYTAHYADAPEIQVEQPTGTIVQAQDTNDFGNSTTRTFIIRNTGRANLTIQKITTQNTTYFHVEPGWSSPVVSQGTSTFTVTFSPLKTGTQKSKILITSDAAHGGSFIFGVTGKGTNSSLASAVAIPHSSKVSLIIPAITSNSITGETQTQDRQGIISTVELADGLKYRVLAITKSPWEFYVKRRVEVSPNLIDWYSGWKHTTVIQDDDVLLKVRDNTPLIPGTKRFIRLNQN